MMEFHISRSARERYQFTESLFSYSGNVVFDNMAACRAFAHRMNQVRDAEKNPKLAVHAGALYAMGLIDEASHVLIARYREQFDPQVMTAALGWFRSLVGSDGFGKMLLTFVEQFPALSVLRGDETAQQWLAGATEGISHQEVALEELLLLWTANRNEAFKPFEELFADKPLAEQTVYARVTEQLPTYFATRPLIQLPNAQSVSLLELLRRPAINSPLSLRDQLEEILELWRPLLGDSLDRLLAVAGEILKEEELAIWRQFNPETPEAAAARAAAEAAARRRRELGLQQWGDIASTAEVPTFGDPALEYEKFSPDTAWMPNTVLIAKSTYVWLAQLSRRYSRGIHRLDEIPDEVLAELAARGMNSLWLIGIWERSRASQTIKQLCGNTDAVASAYSLFDYRIADDLGGDAAYTHLRNRAYAHGIRLASDMVPNHMGIDSPWVVEHPEWFISRSDSPYPAYSFNGPDLSYDSRVEIKIDDHYFEQTDAAVVFRRRDKHTGDTRYVYHGNDGTSFPWNDTAQLDYLNPAVREQVIQTILHVARLFPIIRFDAAMTLAKRHFHRLWFPGPGASGSIPSRAEYGMSDAEFNRIMPHEFWRDVVDRIAVEVPGTLLLAEAFWLMEGYFVRTLGMHRVYNSAFMVMMRDEDNAKYRSVIKNTLEFDPDIMKRYVNFMSNPDERTAIDQFGKGDKCFGVAALMATLPGLPMFGHGQIEGYTEKYGMEYYRPRYDENPDHWLVERHEREIAPLLKRRWLFAESSNFLLYDLFGGHGQVDENVFAYSNRSGNEAALVIYNNRYGTAQGTIHWSAAYADKGSGELRRRSLSEGMGLGHDSGLILAWRDSLTGLEYLRRANEVAERGLTFTLYAYQCHVYLDWRQLRSTAEYPWDRLCDLLQGQGVPDLNEALVNLELRPVQDALRALLDSGIVRLLATVADHPTGAAFRPASGAGIGVGIRKDPRIELERREFLDTAWVKMLGFLRAGQTAYRSRTGKESRGAGDAIHSGLLALDFRDKLRAAMRIPNLEALFAAPWPATARRVLPNPSPQVTATAMWGPVLGWYALTLLAESIQAGSGPESTARLAVELYDRLRLREPLGHAFAALGFEGEEGWRVASRIKVLLLVAAEAAVPIVEVAVGVADDATVEKPTEAAVEAPPVIVPPFAAALWRDPDVRWLAGVHAAQGREYLVRERYEELLWWLQMPVLLKLASEAAPAPIAVAVPAKAVAEALEAAEAVGYRVDRLMGIKEPEEHAPEAEVEAQALEPEDEEVEEEESEAEESAAVPSKKRATKTRTKLGKKD